ncbi:DUF1109 domain-containing protein [Rhodococcus triatomae]
MTQPPLPAPDAPPPREPLVLRDPIERPARPPKLVIATLAMILSTGLVFAAVDWWPGRGRGVDAFTNTAVALALVVLLLVVGLVWAIKTLYVVGRDRRWSWWIAPAPIAVAVAAALILLIPTPSFQSSRGDFDAAARTFLSSSQPHVFDVQVGPYAISRIQRGDNGAVYFYDSEQVFLTVSGGWVYSPAGLPPSEFGIETIESEHIDGPWYEFTSVWRD